MYTVPGTVDLPKILEGRVMTFLMGVCDLNKTYGKLMYILLPCAVKT